MKKKNISFLPPPGLAKHRRGSDQMQPTMLTQKGRDPLLLSTIQISDFLRKMKEWAEKGGHFSVVDVLTFKASVCVLRNLLNPTCRYFMGGKGIQQGFGCIERNQNAF